MRELKEHMRLHWALDKGLSGLTDDPFLAQKVLRAADMKGEEKMKRKLSLGIIVVIALLLAMITAAAAGVVFGSMTSRVAKMDANGQMLRWELPDMPWTRRITPC